MDTVHPLLFALYLFTDAKKGKAHGHMNMWILLTLVLLGMGLMIYFLFKIKNQSETEREARRRSTLLEYSKQSYSVTLNVLYQLRVWDYINKGSIYYIIILQCCLVSKQRCCTVRWFNESFTLRERLTGGNTETWKRHMTKKKHK